MFEMIEKVTRTFSRVASSWNTNIYIKDKGFKIGLFYHPPFLGHLKVQSVALKRTNASLFIR